ncbi:MAG: hypothetical protein DSY77_12845 [Bacteroidetes bacterium]|nr:MAG: hypothetical protein DSY77_12845 [Bacteroidota bacterium]
MIYAQSIEDQKFNLFALFLKEAINGEQKYKKEIDEVLNEVKHLAKGEKELYEVSKEMLQVILFLRNKNEKFFSTEIDEKQIDDKDIYKKMLSSIELKNSQLINEF